MRYREVKAKLVDLPFKPFRMHLSDGSRVDVTEPGMVSMGLSSVLLPVGWKKDEDGLRVAEFWRTVAYSHIVQFGDVNETIEHKRRKRK